LFFQQKGSPFCALTALAFLPALLAGQQPATSAPVAQVPVEKVTDSGITAAPQPEPKYGPDGRIFGVLANYRTADSTKPFKALTVKQKFTIAVHDSFDWPGFFIAGWYTALDQIEGQDPEFGQGIKGYAHRYATSYGDQVIGNMMTEGVMPSLLREDPRYYRKIHGPIHLRALYAVSRILVTRTDKNTSSFNFAEVGGNLVAASIANAYYPQERSFESIAERWQNQLLSDALSNVLKEFWPDIKRRMHHKKKPD